MLDHAVRNFLAGNRLMSSLARVKYQLPDFILARDFPKQKLTAMRFRKAKRMKQPKIGTHWAIGGVRASKRGLPRMDAERCVSLFSVLALGTPTS